MMAEPLLAHLVGTGQQNGKDRKVHRNGDFEKGAYQIQGCLRKKE